MENKEINPQEPTPGEVVRIGEKEYKITHVDQNSVHLRDENGQPLTLPLEEYTSTAQAETRQSISEIMQKNQTNFSNYQKNTGKLGPEEYEKVIQQSYSPSDYQKAQEILNKSEVGLPKHAVIQMAAKLIKTLPNDPRTQNPKWLMTESHLLLGE